MREYDEELDDQLWMEELLLQRNQDDPDDENLSDVAVDEYMIQSGKEEMIEWTKLSADSDEDDDDMET